jgi:hypothetical protein
MSDSTACKRGSLKALPQSRKGHKGTAKSFQRKSAKDAKESFIENQASQLEQVSEKCFSLACLAVKLFSRL